MAFRCNQGWKWLRNEYLIFEDIKLVTRSKQHGLRIARLSVSSDTRQMSIFKPRTNKRDVDKDPHRWTFPSVSSNLSFHPSTQIVIPDPSIFDDAFSQNAAESTTSTLPIIGHLAVHLCLIECFRKLKEGSQILLYSHESEGWDVALRLAASRFRAWHNRIEYVLRHASFYNRSSTNQITEDHLPPLNVLYMWVACLCRLEALRAHYPDSVLFKVPFPWKATFLVIDRENFSYQLTSATQRLFASTTNQSIDLSVCAQAPPAYSEADTQEFEFDLLRAAHELDVFVEKMHELCWIRSPAIRGTLERGITRHQQLKAHPEIMLLISESDPVLDLVYRTSHMLRSAIEEVSDVSVSKDELELDGEPQVDCFCWTCEAIRDIDATYSRGQPLPSISKDQLAELKLNIGFHKQIEEFRRSQPPGMAFPMRPLKKAQVEKKYLEQERIDGPEWRYGYGYKVTKVRPAVYDEGGRLIRPGKVKIT